MRLNAAIRAAAAVGALLALALLAGCGSSSGEGGADFTGSGYPNNDLANTRAVGGPIDTSTVGQLEQVWTLPIEAQSTFGAYAGAPVVAKGVVYSQDLESNVQAIDLESGEVLWERRFDSPSHGPNGVVVQEGRVYGATATGAFALDQETGKVLWEEDLVRNASEGVDMAPGHHDGRVYVSTVPVNTREFYGGGGVGILWALDAKTGRRLWSFDTVPKGLWGNPQVNSGGGLWYPPAFDGRGGVYAAIGNPGPIPGTPEFPWGSSRPGPNLYTDSVVKLDAETGKLRWYYQQTPHDVNDWDLQNPPILLKSKGRDIVIGAGKSGFVIALDRESGELIWERSVGIHNGHDDIGRETMDGRFRPKTPVTLYPGALGGVIAPAATDGSTIYVPVVNHPLTILANSEKQENGPMEGELVALDVDSGAVQWKHKFESAPFGATMVVNDLVFATTYDGNVYAFDAEGGEIVWQASLPTGTNVGVTVSGDTLLAPAGVPLAQGAVPQIVAYRLSG